MTRDAYDQALHLLEFRARSIAELRRKLVQRGCDVAEVNAVIQRLVEQNFLNDDDFARQFARAKVLGAGASRVRIVQELARKGVTRAVAEKAVDELPEAEGIDPAAAIHRVAEKKLKSLGKLDALTRKRRLYAFLARRGFRPDEIRAALTALGEALET
jgi:regulatory protein